MRIDKILLKNFRNYAQQEIVLSPFTNIIYGNNAQGKTNLLEAMYLFSQGRSYRTKSDKELIRFGDDCARLYMDFSDNYREYNAFMQFSKDGKKMIKINEVPITKLSMLMNYLNVVMFSPQDLELVKGAPSTRRRFLDLAISQMYPKYLSELMRYHKTLAQKNSLLKTLKRANVSADYSLTVWNEQLSEYGCNIIKYRDEFLKDISASVSAIYSEIGREKLEIYYTPSINYDIMKDSGIKEKYFDYLEAHQAREIEFGSSLYGIQRDDMNIFIDGKEAKIYGSQGQQRSTVLSLKIAQTEYIHEKKNEYPVLLLDDVMSELDVNRRAYLSERIRDKQVVITCTDTDAIQNTDNTKLFHVDNGRII